MLFRYEEQNVKITKILHLLLFLFYKAECKKCSHVHVLYKVITSYPVLFTTLVPS